MQPTDFRRAAELELRADSNGGMPTLEVTFARFDVWSEIYSWREGRFLERIERGAFADTFAERADKIRCLYDHGHDPTVGNKPLGAVASLRETTAGPVGEVPLFDTGYVRDLLPAIEAGQLGASYRFGVYSDDEVVGEQWDRDPGVSAHNPQGLPERTLTRVNVAEFGPVTFPADEGTSNAVRSLELRFAHDRDSFRTESAEGQTGASAPLNDGTDREDIATAFAIARRSRG